MKERLTAKLNKPVAARIFQKLPLLLIMLAIGTFTVYAASNTYEVMARQDVGYSNVITSVVLTDDQNTDQQFVSAQSARYDTGSFGIPKKIKLPETNKHFDIIGASFNGSWKASRGIGQTFVTANERQKVFGQAVIYMRTNTPTTRDIGEVYAGDVVNIVTTEGWQLGYQVVERAGDPSKLNISGQEKDSEIVVVLIDDQTGERISFRAILTKVGERI